MNPRSPDHRFRSCARSLKRFGEALKRRARSSESRFEGFARARAHPPIPPRGVRSSDAPGFRSRARARAKRSSEDGDPTEMAALASIAASSPPAERSAQPMTELTIPTNPIASTVDHRCLAHAAVLSVLSASEVLSVVSGAERVEVLSVVSEASAAIVAADRWASSPPSSALATPASGVSSVVSVLSEVHGALAQWFCQLCRFCHRCNVRRNRGFCQFCQTNQRFPPEKAGQSRPAGTAANVERHLLTGPVRILWITCVGRY